MRSLKLTVIGIFRESSPGRNSNTWICLFLKKKDIIIPVQAPKTNHRLTGTADSEVKTGTGLLSVKVVVTPDSLSF